MSKKHIQTPLIAVLISCLIPVPGSYAAASSGLDVGDDTIVMLKSNRQGAIGHDYIVTNVRETYKELLSNPPKSQFNADLDSVLNGKKPLVALECGCRYQQFISSRTQDVGQIISFGADDVSALKFNQRNCVEQSFETELQSLTLNGESLRWTDDLWGKLGNVQSISSYDCHQLPPLLITPDFLSQYRQALAADAASASKQIDGNRPGKGSSWFIFSKAPDWLRVTLSALLGGFAWRARGGAIPTGSTQAARGLFGFLPYVLISYINSDDETTFVDGAVMAALGAAPLFTFGWSTMQGMGHGYLEPTADQYGQWYGMTLRGVVQTMFAAGYAEARGYDPDPLLAGGASMGTCYFASFKLSDAVGSGNVLDKMSGNIDNPILNATTLNYGSNRGEACFGTIYGMTLAQTLREGRIRDTDFQLSDVYTKSGELIKKYIEIAGNAELAIPAQEHAAVQDHSQNQNLEKPLNPSGMFNPSDL